MNNPIPAELLSDQVYYTAHFMDLAIWEPLVRRVCEQHGFECRRVDIGLPGSFPTFLVELDADGVRPDSGMIVVKFFGPLFDGVASFSNEREIGHYLFEHPLPVGSPAILAEGSLDPEWSYLIFEGVPGASIGQIGQQLLDRSWMSVAAQMGRFMKALHTGMSAAVSFNPIPTKILGWGEFVEFLEIQEANCHTNHQRWNDLPPHLLEQVRDYLLPIDRLVDLSSPPHLIHADLTGDHLLGRLIPSSQVLPTGSRSGSQEGADWESLSIIDWGDARVGNILYELVALQLDLFLTDKHRLGICLEQYGLSDFYQQDFPRKALNMVLLHQFPMPSRVYESDGEVQTLQELAERLFDV